MKKLLLPILIGAILLGCSKKNTEIPKIEETLAKECNPKENATANIAEAQKWLIGTWKLTVYNTGWFLYPEKDTPDQKLIFKDDGTFTIIRKDITIASIKYSLQPSSKPGSYFGVPSLMTADTILASTILRPVGTSSLFICDNKMIFDYGMEIYADASVLTYRREVK